MSVSRSSAEDASPLMQVEIVWRDRYNMLESHGYRLRPRFAPDWKPSWIGSKKRPQMFEDYYVNRNSDTIDAVRISDGRRVFLKRVLANRDELTIHRYLCDKERINDPRNHTAPLLDDFLDDGDTDFAFLVLPLLRAYFKPDFFYVDEVVDFMKQLLEGAVYMHKLDIAHRDCSELNIMMDADKMFPRGFHPTNSVAEASGFRLAKPKRRRDVSYVKYYFIDFGISSIFGPDERDRRVLGIHCQDGEVPELSDTEPYDPFLVDVFILGNLFKKVFLERYANLDFLEPLIEQMTEPSCRARFTSNQALRSFREIVYSQSWYTLRWRLKEKSTRKTTQVFQDMGTLPRETVYLAKTIMQDLARETGQSLRNCLVVEKAR